jgi:hypothetical protein
VVPSPPRLAAERAVDVDGGEERQSPLLVQDDGEVVVREEVARLAGRLRVQCRLRGELVGENRERDGLAQEVRVVSRSVGVVRVDVDPRSAAAQPVEHITHRCSA